MTPDAALSLLQRQPKPVRQAVETVLLSIDAQALTYFGVELLRWVADAVQGRHKLDGPAIKEWKR